MFDLSDIFFEEGVSRETLVDFGTVADGFGAHGIVESGEGFFHVGAGGRNGGDDAGLGASSERVLKETGELRFADTDGQAVSDPISEKIER